MIISVHRITMRASFRPAQSAVNSGVAGRSLFCTAARTASNSDEQVGAVIDAPGATSMLPASER